MTTTLEQEIKSYMRLIIEEYLDCGEVNCTGLAVDASDEFPGADIEDCFEYAFEISQEYEAKQ